MPRLRFSIARLMGIVLVSAVGLAAWHNADEPWAGVMLLLTWGILCLAIVGAVYCKGARRAWWLGFAIFGWGYFALLRCCQDWDVPLNPLHLLLEILEPWMAPPPRPDWTRPLAPRVRHPWKSSGLRNPYGS